MKKLLTIFLIIIIGTLLTIILWKNGLSPVNPLNNKSQIFVVQKGSGLKEIANNLNKEHLIKSRIVFFLYTRLGKFEGRIQAGQSRSKRAKAQAIDERVKRQDVRPIKGQADSEATTRWQSRS